MFIESDYACIVLFTLSERNGNRLPLGMLRQDRSEEEMDERKRKKKNRKFWYLFSLRVL